MSAYYKVVARNDSLFVPLSQEFSHCKCHLEIQSIRFSERIHAIWGPDPRLDRDIKTPCFILQKIFENCYKHRLKNKECDGLIWRRVTEDIFNGEIDMTQMKQMFQEYDIRLSPDEDILLLVGQADKFEFKRLRKYIYAINKISNEILDGQCRVFVFLYDGRYVVWLMQQLGEGRAQDVVRLARGDIEKLQRMCKDISGVSLSVILSGRFVPWRDASENFNALNKKLNRFFGLSDEMVIQETEETEEDGIQIRYEGMDEYKMGFLVRKINFMRLFLESAQQEEFIRNLDEFAEEIRRYTNMPRTLETEIVMQMNLMFYTVISRKRLEGEIAKYYSLDRLTRIDEDMDLLKLIMEYREMSQFIFKNNEVKNLSNMSVVFGKLRCYIHDNLVNDLSLQRLAQIVHFSPGYLSRLFKAVINKSVSEYIGEVKLHRSCELLQDTDMRVSDVAFMVGYENQQNFTRFFKKHMNVSPIEYRESTKTAGKTLL